MKKIIFKTIALFFFLMSFTLSAQDFQGKAFYQSKTNVDLKLENHEMSDDQKNRMQEMLKKQFEKSFVLTFNKEASIYKEEEQLDKPTGVQKGGMQIIVMGNGADEKLYKNIKKKKYAREQNLFGKAFLVKDELKPQGWKLVGESKMIGKYLCFKATAVREVEKMGLTPEHKDDKKSNEVKEEMEEQTITAWYTTNIPVSHGPDNYWGLPGLIMELNVDKTQYLCTKIVMNAKDKMEIKEPTKGKVITSEKYRELMEKKMKEMQEKRGRESRGDGKRFNIQIGG